VENIGVIIASGIFERFTSNPNEIKQEETIRGHFDKEVFAG
jgi:hypothetical protein